MLIVKTTHHRGSFSLAWAGTRTKIPTGSITVDSTLMSLRTLKKSCPGHHPLTSTILRGARLEVPRSVSGRRSLITTRLMPAERSTPQKLLAGSRLSLRLKKEFKKKFTKN